MKVSHLHRAGRIRAKAQLLGRGFLAAYLLVLFTPVSVAANLSLCICDECTRLEASPLLSCTCQAAEPASHAGAAGCTCCGGQAVAVGDTADGAECPSILLPMTPAVKIELPEPQWDEAHLLLTLNVADLPLTKHPAPMLEREAPATRLEILEIRTVRLLM